MLCPAHVLKTSAASDDPDEEVLAAPPEDEPIVEVRSAVADHAAAIAPQAVVTAMIRYCTLNNALRT